VKIFTHRLILLIFCCFSACGDPYTFNLISSQTHARKISPTRLIHPGNPHHHKTFLRRGWGNPEGTGAWTTDRASRALFFVTGHTDLTLTLDCRALPNISPAQTLDIHVGDDHVSTITLTEELSTYNINIPANCVIPGWNILSFIPSRLDRPVTLGLGPDNRNLAVYFRSIQFDSRQNVPDEQPEIDVRNICHLSPGDRLFLTFAAPAHLDFKIKASTGKPVRSAEISLAILQDDEQEVHYSRHRGFQGAVVWKHSVELMEGKPVLIQLDNEGNTPFNVQVSASQPLPQIPDFLQTKFSNPVKNNTSILVAVLDACAPEFLGCHGNPDSNTPFIDRIADSGIQFSNAVSTASYTVTSVAGMLSGTLPFEHGVNSIGQTLNPGIKTIAQMMQISGYHTMGFSAMPTVSKAWQFDRGFKQFFELFQGRSEPLTATETVEGAIRELKSVTKRPLFCYLHIREPHAPYSPPELWRMIYGKPEPSKGSIDYLSECDRKLERNQSIDLDNIRRLYQSQLAFADRSLEQMVRTFFTLTNGSSRFIILSDHGEAFGQHNRLMHNSTVYQEMIHIPWIQFDPSDLKKTRIIDSLQCNRDLMIYLKDQNLIEPGTGWKWHRTAGDKHYFQGIKNAVWHYIEGGYYPARELYSVPMDPGEMSNIVSEYPVTAEYLHAVIRSIGSEDSASKSLELGETDPHMITKLKALGYLR
jgi:arylsulfatase A-like enzyme